MTSPAESVGTSQGKGREMFGAELSCEECVVLGQAEEGMEEGGRFRKGLCRSIR